MLSASVYPARSQLSGLQGILSNLIDAALDTEDTATAGRLFQEALASEVQLSAHTINRLINQLGRSKQLEEAVDVVTTLTSKGFAADKFTFTALLNACQRVNAGELAFTIWRCGNQPIRLQRRLFAGVASCRRAFRAG